MRDTRRFGLGLLLLVSAGALATCGDTAGQSEEFEPAQRVTLRSFEFRPSDIRVEAGAEVVWTNEDAILHTATSGAAGEQGVPGVSEDLAPAPDGLFDLELDGKGSTGSFTFEAPGTYAYFCAIHNGMSGTVQVV